MCRLKKNMANRFLFVSLKFACASPGGCAYTYIIHVRGRHTMDQNHKSFVVHYIFIFRHCVSGLVQNRINKLTHSNVLLTQCLKFKTHTLHIQHLRLHGHMLSLSIPLFLPLLSNLYYKTKFFFFCEEVLRVPYNTFRLLLIVFRTGGNQLCYFGLENSNDTWH